jgi:hypothetical protein
LLLVQSFKRPQSNVLRLHPVGNTRQSRAQKGYVNKHNRRTEDRKLKIRDWRRASIVLRQNPADIHSSPQQGKDKYIEILIY